MAIVSKREDRERRALNISMYTGIFFVVVQFIMSVITNSQAVLLDCVYDAAEAMMIFISLFLVPLLYQPSTERYPFGYNQFESVFIVIKGLMMVLVTFGLVVNNIHIALSGGHKIQFTIVAFFELFALLISVVVIVALRYANKKLNSPLVKVELSGWIIDSIASLGMTVAFFLPSWLDSPGFMKILPYLDQIIAITLSLFILPLPVKAIISGLRDVFLMAPNKETMNTIKLCIDTVLNEYNFSDITYDIVKTGRKLWVSVYVSPQTDNISITKMALIQKQIKNKLKKQFPDIYFELLPDIE